MQIECDFVSTFFIIYPTEFLNFWPHAYSSILSFFIIIISTFPIRHEGLVHGALVGVIGPGGFREVSGNVVRMGIRLAVGAPVMECCGFRAVAQGAAVAPGIEVPGWLQGARVPAD